MSINNNETHKFVNLSHALLSIIVYNLKDNIDKICFSLVCKRWFDNRNRYLLFDSNNLYCIDKDSSRITLSSFRSLIYESISQKKQCSMLVSSQHRDIGIYDHIVDLDSIESIDEIDQNIVKASMSIYLQYGVDKSDKLFTRLYDLIGKSNVTSIEECRTLKHRIPTNITSLSFEHFFNEPLFKGCFPPNLKKLKLHGNFNQVIEVGVLPDTLESFEIFTLSQILEPGVLPTSLKVFKILDLAPDNYLKVGSLPPNLEEFVHHGRDIYIDSNVLPNSLIKLHNAPVSWMMSIKNLENLRSLNFTCPGIIPNSVNNLFIQDRRDDIVIPEGILPDSVQNIKLSQVLFPTTTKMVDNISFKGYRDNKSCIRKLDDQYYIVFGYNNNKFIASLFHKSMFLDRVNVVKILLDKKR
ncbi:hypothetical protein PPL_09399 [Heterostelium album PN500]|uniref:COI1 F-box domain-containing protein n=1 Tax=Heterostelium pallidum (strain ATCC 26659 / Pp 5 / PN500) TaxID=670386 RepID=D3BLG5_HETP5|nr:hypothetical protein PPL_09399 [Heterostelium album PN500]EFA77899.1 hypothetical protein PPL_09399 [Heterostelium album PN500]|eukprot:XP_020430027.1 hypothetical protein PPL_09399 [Heterostelium album PN500]